MSLFGRTRAWVRAVVRRNTMEREMHEEMAAHIAQAAERFRERGMSERDAALAARREFGHVGTLQQSAREARGGQWVEDLVADLRYALRYFARAPLATVTIVLTLALGIGFSSAVFSTLHGIFMRPAPGVPDDPTLVKIRGISNAPPFGRAMSFPELRAYAGLNGTFASVAGWTSSGVVVDLGDVSHGALIADGAFVTPNFFTTLGVRLAVGRSFSQTRFDDLAEPELTAVVSHRFAAELFGEAMTAIGKEVKVNDVPVTIIGITAPGFNGPVQSGQVRRIWLPLSALPLVEKFDRRKFTDLNVGRFEAVARLQAGVAEAQAVAAVGVVASRIDADAKVLVKRASIGTADVVRLRGLIDPTRYAEERGPVAVLFSIIAILILLVCTTTVNSLLVGAGVARRYEIGVRLAMGASRARIIRQLLTEVAILAIAGGALGMWTFGALSRITEVAQDGFDVSPDWATAGFTIFYALATAILAGLSPALHATRAGLADVLKDNAAGATRKSRVQRTFVIAQIAIAQPLMVALAAVTTHIFSNIPALGNVTVRERLMILSLDTRLRYVVNAPDRMPDVMRRLAELPGVVKVLPVSGGSGWATLNVPTTIPAKQTEPVVPISGPVFPIPSGYFEAVDSPIIRGRDFVAGDTALAVTPVILSKPLAAKLFTGVDPIGRRIRQLSYDNTTPTELEVIGVVDMTTENNTLEYPPESPPMFVPLRERGGRLLIRTSAPADALMPSVMAVAREEARLFPVSKIGTLARADQERRDSRMGVFGAGAACGLVVLVLAAVGLYGMLSIAVGQRRREIGIRVALGARASQVVMMFFGSGVRVALIGVAFGLPLSLVGLAGLPLYSEQSWLHQVWTAGSSVTLAVLIIASLASWLPARRAAHVDPMLALRAE